MNVPNTKNDVMKPLAFHPFLFSAYAVAALFANNMDGTEPVSTIRVLVAVWLLTSLIFLVFKFITSDPRKAALSTTVIVLFLFSYGHLYNLLKKLPFLTPIIRHRYFLPALICLVGYILWRLVKINGRKLAPLTLYLNAVSLFLMAMPVFTIGRYFLASYPKASPSVEAAGNFTSSPDQPDIYYIILDAYGREDILRDVDQIDNTSFIEALKQRGFYVASQSESNYMQTVLSLSSSLNMDYLQDLGYDSTSSLSRSSLPRLYHTDLVENRVRQVLAEKGYQFVAFETGYVTSIRRADIYFEPGPDDMVTGQGILQLNSFETLFLDTTVVQAWFDLQQKSGQSALQAPYLEHRSRILYTFKTLAEIPKMDGAHFVFAHVIVPHPPFVFGRDGEIITNTRVFTLQDAQHYSPDEYTDKYSAQLQYTNKMVLSTLDTILRESKVPPIIIIQGDHGPGAHLDWNSVEKSNLPERFGILNAYYFPDQDYSRIPADITPVNSFRVVLDQYFDADLPLLPNRNYFSTWKHPFDFIEVTDRLHE